MNPGRRIHSHRPLTRTLAPALAVLVALAATLSGAAAAPKFLYSEVDALLRKHCLDCHATQEPEGKLVLESFESTMSGGESGPAVVPGKSAESPLFIAVDVGLLREGKRKVMPPGKREKLKPEEIAVLKGWIDAGAPAPAPSETMRRTRELIVPRIAPTVVPPRSIRAAAYSTALNLLALARHAEVELVSPDSRQVVRRLTGIRGAVNALAFSKDGQTLAVASGEPALFGQATLWQAAEGRLIRTIEAHTDALHAIALSPDSQTLATGSYDQRIKLWNTVSGELRHTLSAHNAAIFSLAFRPDGKTLASASGDRTVKLWQTASGKRVETLSQSLKDVYALAWSPDGQHLAAAGVDNRIRIWSVSESAGETTNPLLISKYAHEGAILSLAWAPDGKTLLSSADDQTVKLWAWDGGQITERKALEKQPDLAPALAFLPDGKRFVAGRMDGSWEIYETAKGAPAAWPKPGLSHVEPRGVANGFPVTLKLFGTNLASITGIASSHPNLRAGLLSATPDVATAMVEAGVEVPRGAHELWARGPGGDSARIKVYVDNIRRWDEAHATNIFTSPSAVWGTLESSGDIDDYRYEARAGQTLVIELATRSVGSKLPNGAIALLDAEGNRLAADAGFDGADRFAAFPIARDAIYTARVSDQMLTTSRDHFYRLTIGPLPLVTGIFPLGVPANQESDVRLVGFNLPPNARVRLKAGGGGEMEVPVDAATFRATKAFKALVATNAGPMELEPNDAPAQATPVAVPAEANGRIDRVGDVDLYRFAARRGQHLILETDAARRGSPADTRIEVLDPEGKPVPRVRLQAVRNTAINFRGVDSNGTGIRLDNYEEMELNEYLYMNGDVMRLFRMPQGPDSDMMMYTSAGKRRAYFDTTAVSHALDEQGFIVEPRPLDGALAPNGLPVFIVHYDNDDDGERRLGADARLHFTAPSDGVYLARVTDTRGHGGDTLAYRLIVREARPDFAVTLAGANPAVPPGSGQSFTLTAERRDGFEGEIRVEINGLPPGFSVSSPLTIEAGHTEAKGTLFAASDAPQPDGTNVARTTIIASAVVDGRTMTREVNSLGTIQLGAKPKLYVGLEPFRAIATNHYDPATVPSGGERLELTIGPGETIPAWLKIHRNGHQDLVTFFAENLPHGVIVADIGLNGVLIPKEESERQIFFNAARWVPEQERLFYMIEQQAGRQTSRPILLKVRKR